DVDQTLLPSPARPDVGGVGGEDRLGVFAEPDLGRLGQSLAQLLLAGPVAPLERRRGLWRRHGPVARDARRLPARRPALGPPAVGPPGRPPLLRPALAGGPNLRRARPAGGSGERRPLDPGRRRGLNERSVLLVAAGGGGGVVSRPRRHGEDH